MFGTQHRDKVPYIKDHCPLTRFGILTFTVLMVILVNCLGVTKIMRNKYVYTNKQRHTHKQTNSHIFILSFQAMYASRQEKQLAVYIKVAATSN